MKIRLNAVHYFALFLLALMMVCLTQPAQPVRAAIGILQAWSLVYQGPSFPPTSAPYLSYSVPSPGFERLLVVAVSSTTNNNFAQSAAASYGSRAMTLAVENGNNNSRTNTYLFYLRDTPSVMNGANQNLIITFTGTGSSRYNYVYAAVYEGVDQSAPISNSRNRYRTTASSTIGPFTSLLNIANGDRAVEMINLTSNTSTPRTISFPSGNWFWVLGPNISNQYSSYISENITPGTTNSQHTASGTCYSSMSAMTIHRSLNTPTPTFTATFTPTYTVSTPLGGTVHLAYIALLLNAPDFGFEPQTISGRVSGGGGPPYTIVVHVIDPEGDERVFPVPVDGSGNFLLDHTAAGDDYFGCNIEKIWSTWYRVTDSLGDSWDSPVRYWAVNFPKSHGVP
jgi:hypothetical protein